MSERRIRDLERRVKALETIVLAWTTGKVEIQGVMHLLECEKRNSEKSACTCGAVPLGSPNRKKKE